MKFQDNMAFRNITVAKFQCPKFTKKRATTQNISFFFQFFTKYSIQHPLSADTSFKFLALILFRGTAFTKFIPSFSKGPNFTRGDNSEKIICVCYFSMRNPYIKFQDDISMPQTYINTYGQAETNMLPTFSKLGA